MSARKQPGGRVLEHAKIVLVFLGDGWSTGVVTAPEAEGFARAVVATPYFSYLYQYDGICLPEVVSAVTGPTDIGKLGPDPRGFLPGNVRLVSDSDLTTALSNIIDKQPRPQDEQTLFMAIVSSTTAPVLTDHTDAAGFHYQFDHRGRKFAYGVVMLWAANTVANIWRTGNGLPAVFVHEVTEALTDPDGGTGYRLDPPQSASDPGENEVSDFAPDALTTIPGLSSQVLLEGYWSNVHNTWVVPTGYSLRAALGQQSRTRVASVRAALGGGPSTRQRLSEQLR